MKETYLVVSGSIKDKKKVEAYKASAGPIMKKYGGELPPQSFSVPLVLAGKASPAFLLKIAFPAREKIEAAFNDPDYKKVISQRDEGFKDLSIFIAEK